MPGPNQVIAAQLAQRKLNTRDRKLQETLRDARPDLWYEELTPENISALLYEIQRTKDPKGRAILQQELERLKGLADMMESPPKEPSPWIHPTYTPAPDAPPAFGGPPRIIRDTPPGGILPWQMYLNPDKVPNPIPAMPYPGPAAPRG